jgi:hypothetical protein
MGKVIATWAARKAVGDDHEGRVRLEIERRGWTVAPYGQGILPEQVRNALRLTDSTMRWDPDFVAAHGSTLCLVDAKSSMRGDDAWTYTISRKAVRAHLRMWVELDLPVFYVFSNLGVATPAEVLQFCRLTTVGEAGGYLSFPAGRPRPFDDVFGSPPGEAFQAAA